MEVAPDVGRRMLSRSAWLKITFRRPCAGGRTNWQIQQQPADLHSPSGSSGRKLQMGEYLLASPFNRWFRLGKPDRDLEKDLFWLVAISYGPAGRRPTET